MKEHRKFPRLDLYYEGKCDLPMIHGKRITLPMLVTSVSPEGVSIAVSNLAMRPPDGSLVTVRFTSDGIDLVLPTRIAWNRRSGNRTEFGLEILLDQMPTDMAEKFARWIVEQFKNKPKPMLDE